ncbi:DUF1758 domain-containing protein [Trichonephila clavata]|uniref:DUF1758 domain-containing protein n=1 Tax=Trichonephila clavata TaxID=2740835 RepID=A0A8X6GEK5_TRICU|nr:DUF1758 domain-containing protein [Trichonephila clavata]
MSLTSLNRQRGTCKRNNKGNLNELKQSYCDLPEQVDLKDALEIAIDLEEVQQLEVSLQIILSQFKKENDNQITKNNIKLKDLPLPTFSGKFQEFELFKNQFMNVIGNNSSLNDTKKLCYLKSALKNDASLIQSDQDSFESLIDALRNRYENKRALVDIHISEILSVPKVQRSENPAQLRFLIDTVRSHLRSLKNLKMDSNVLSDAILLHMLNSKIDKESQRLFQLNLKTTEVPSLQDLFSFLETRCIQLESVRKTDSDLVISQGCILADEDFNQPSEISCLIGSEHFFDIFGPQQIQVSNSNFRLAESKFGFVVTGSYIDEPCYFKHCFLSKGWNTLDKTLRSFWETENISEEQPIISDELSYCEDHFERTHFRKPCGRYILFLYHSRKISRKMLI